MDTTICKGLTFEECELTILRLAVDKAENKLGKRFVNSDHIQKVIAIVQEFIEVKQLVCYGGTAINNILPKGAQFYNKYTQLPDYDVLSSTALEDAKELASLYVEKGYTNVVAKAGMHHGTYKVFVDFVGVADITQMSEKMLSIIRKEAIVVKNILYAPPNFLRMSMYLELSRPVGDVTRWEKVYKRLLLLNKHYPVSRKVDCKGEVQRKLSMSELNEPVIHRIIKSTLVQQGCVFFGGYAQQFYKRSGSKKDEIQFADFEALSKDPLETANKVKDALEIELGNNVRIIRHNAIEELIPLHYEICIEEDTVAFIYKTIGCHSFNYVTVEGVDKKIKVATIDTMLSFYLAFMYANTAYFQTFKHRFLCMSIYLFNAQIKNRLAQTGVFKRFTTTCYGHQPTLETIKTEKTLKFNKLKGKTNSKEYEEWFLNYNPASKKTVKRAKKK